MNNILENILKNIKTAKEWERVNADALDGYWDTLSDYLNSNEQAVMSFLKEHFSEYKERHLKYFFERELLVFCDCYLKLKRVTHYGLLTNEILSFDTPEQCVQLECSISDDLVEVIEDQADVVISDDTAYFTEYVRVAIIANMDAIADSLKDIKDSIEW